MSRVMKAVPLVVLCALIIAPPSVWASWVKDGVPICTATRDQAYPIIVSDGAGGAIITWIDYRSGNWDIYAQRVNAFGTVQWTPDGVALCIATADQQHPAITSDGAGGAIVTWEDNRGGDHHIYAQRVNASGAVQWATDGVALCAATGDQYHPQITSDSVGGAIVTWGDARSGNNDIYAQRVNASGTVQWTPNGVALCTASGSQQSPTITCDGAGGAIVTWQDARGSIWGIYAQRVDASGTPLWTVGGVALCTATVDQFIPIIVSDGAGGAIVAWENRRIGISHIHAQRVNASGVVQWTSDGIALCTATMEQYNAAIVSDGAGGAIVTWENHRTGNLVDVYAQRLNASGALQWTTDGVALCTAPAPRQYPTIISDGAGGAIVAWEENRDRDYHIYAQRVNASGTVLWMTDGVALCTAKGSQCNPIIVSDGAGGAIVTWLDTRNVDMSQTSDIYAQRVDANGLRR